MTNTMPTTVDLSGSWRFALDRDGQGDTRQWFAADGAALTDACVLPGSIQQQGFGDDVTTNTPWTADRNGSDRFDVDPKYAPYREPGRVKFPYWLQPAKYYAGVAWFARDVVIPDDWRGRRIVLHLERAHWQTTVWVDGETVGPPCDSLSTPHEHDLTARLGPGRHTVVLRVDNCILHNVGPNAHSVSDHTQGNWNGVIGAIELRATPTAGIDAVSIRTDLSARRMKFAVRLRSVAMGHGYLMCRGVRQDVRWGDQETQLHMSVPCDGLPLWSEHAPDLIDSVVTLHDAGGIEIDRRTIRHGVREITTRGTQILINGQPTLLRGTLECCIFPLTGYPPTDVGSWRHVMSQLKRHGLNHLRFHSWCPPEAAFAAADEAGVYVQVECAAWPNQGATIGDGASVDAWLYEEGRRIVDAYGHHPSFVMLACGNEPAGASHLAFLKEWITFWKREDPQRLHTGGAGWPENNESDFHIRFQPRIHHWGEGLGSRINAGDVDTTVDYRDEIAAFDKPTVTHEIGQWCAYPDLAAISKYSGVYRATAFEIAQDSLTANGLGHLAHEFLMASGKLQALAYKEEIESQLRTPGLGGFQLLDLHDFPGQGTALVGVLDAFWESKGYVTSAEFRRFCGPAVLLARIAKRIYTPGELFTATIDLSYFDAAPKAECRVQWRVLTDGGASIAEGTFDSVRLVSGELRRIGELAVSLANIEAPTALRLCVDADGVAPSNEWSFWVFDPTEPTDSSVLITRDLDDDFAAATAAGRPILFCPRPEAIASPVALGFSPIFWNTLFTNGQAPHTLGLLIDTSYPAFESFPTAFHSDWQWQEPVRHAACLMLDRLGDHRPQQPIIRVIDDWNKNRSLSLLFEARVGHSRVLVCGIDLTGDLTNRVASRQLRSALISTTSKNTAPPPEITMTVEQLRRLVQSTEKFADQAKSRDESTYGRQ